jgi:hypothetical protein
VSSIDEICFGFLLSPPDSVAQKGLARPEDDFPLGPRHDCLHGDVDGVYRLHQDYLNYFVTAQNHLRDENLLSHNTMLHNKILSRRPELKGEKETPFPYN